MTLHTERFRIRKSKPGLGHGLFARILFKKGDFIAEYTGVRIPTPYADTLTTRYLFEVDEKWTVDGSPRTNIARYINHACKPNCEADIFKGKILIHAVKNVALGDELTMDYGDEYFKEFIKPHGCKCATCFPRVSEVSSASDKKSRQKNEKSTKDNLHHRKPKAHIEKVLTQIRD